MKQGRILYENKKKFSSVILLVTVAFFINGCAGSSDDTPAAPLDPLSGTSLYADVVKYASYDNHRTASAGDIATSKWLEASLKEAGLETDVKAWTLNQFDLTSSTLIVNGQTIKCFPGWYPNTTAVTGPVAKYNAVGTGDLTGKVAYVGIPDGLSKADAGIVSIVEKAAAAGAIGLVVVIGAGPSDTGLITAFNAKLSKIAGAPEYHQEPLPIPVVVIGSDDDLKLQIAALAGSTASISIVGENKAGTTAYNVFGFLRKGVDKKWVVISTPYSGWFKAGGERGPGVALWLGLARWIAKQNQPYNYLFIANSGHELNQMGGQKTMDEMLPGFGINKDNVVSWLGLGASIGNRSWTRNGNDYLPSDTPNPSSYLSSIPELAPSVQAAYKDVEGLILWSGDGTYFGELKDIIARGYKAAGFFGLNYFFHTTMDTEKETSPELLDPIGKATKNYLEAINSN